MDRFDLAWAGVILAGISAAWYIRTIFWGTTRPHRITWGVWSLIGLLGVGSAIEGGAHAGAYVALFFLCEQIFIFLVSLTKKYGKPGGESYDYPLGLVAVVAIILWRVADLPPGFAAVVAISADAIVLWFTLRESWRQPKTESLGAWSLAGLASAFGLAASSNFSFAAIAYPAYLIFGNLSVAVSLGVRRWQHRSSDKPV